MSIRRCILASLMYTCKHKRHAYLSVQLCNTHIWLLVLWIQNSQCFSAPRQRTVSDVYGERAHQSSSACHQVHVIRCMSSDACHQVHVIRCMSSGACHQVHVIRCMSSGACHQMHVKISYIVLYNISGKQLYPCPTVWAI